MHWPESTRWRALLFGLGIGAATLLVIGIPTAVIPSPLFGRAVPTRPADYLFLGLTTILAASLGATYAAPSSCSLQENRLTAGGFLSFLAVGCPVCNKIVVLALGASGAMTYFAPIQPVLAAASIVLLGSALYLRLRAIGALRRIRAAGES